MPPKSANEWQGEDSKIVKAVEDFSDGQFRAYKEHPPLVIEHANLERAMVEGAYGRRQLYELIQNGADEMLKSGGRIEVVLTKDAMYCANEGKPFTAKGATTLLGSHVSAKQGSEIGRFGLGFKSVLGITNRPQVISRTGSFEFDLLANKARVEEAFADVDRVPVLRFARGVDPTKLAKKDEVLAQLMKWASTVIRLPRDRDESIWLNQDMKQFPAEFLVFSSHVSSLVLDDREDGLRRELAIEKLKGGGLVLTVDGDAKKWHVEHRVVNPSDAAKRDGGYSADRDEVPIHWAIGEGARGLGELWAFFPTRDQTTMRGVINAPWKLSDDRETLLAGAFNEDLIENACMMILDSLEDVIGSKDPGEVLDIIPARGRETRSWADEMIGKYVYDIARFRPVLPDQYGELQMAGDVALHPEDLPEKALELWAKYYAGDDLWCHHTVDSRNRRERRPRAARLIESVNGRVAEVDEWLQALLDDSLIVESSREAILVAGAAVEAPELAASIRSIPIILLADGATRVDALDSDVFIPADAEGLDLDVRTVHPHLAKDPDAIDALRALGVPQVSAESMLRARLQDESLRKQGADWREIWELGRGVGAGSFSEILRELEFDQSVVCVRTADGSWSRLCDTLMPGPVLSAEVASDEDARCLVDVDWHAQDKAVLDTLGASTGPVAGRGSTEEPWYEDYVAAMTKEFVAHLQTKNVSKNSIEIEGVKEFAGPLTPGRWLSPPAQAKFFAVAFDRSEDPVGVEIFHSTNSKIPARSIPHPLVWLVQKAGVIQTTDGPRPLDEVAASTLDGLDCLLPKALLRGPACKALGLPSTLGELTERQWAVCLSAAAEEDNVTRRVDCYLAACEYVSAPEQIAADSSSGPVMAIPQEIAVALNAADVEALRVGGIPHLAIPDGVDPSRLIERWGLMDAGEIIRSEIFAVAVSEPATLVDDFPSIRQLLPQDKRGLLVTVCSDLAVDRFTSSGKARRQESFLVDGRDVYRHESLSDEEFLERISDRFALGLDFESIKSLINVAHAQATNKYLQKLRKASDDEARLLLLVDLEELRQRLPVELHASLERTGELDDRGAVASAFLGAYGLESLAELKDVLEQHEHVGPIVPGSWAGSTRAIAFVDAIGFDRAFAGFRDTGDRAPVVEVDGPIALPPLHDFQSRAGEAIKKLATASPAQRGMLSLPTGAGKTRVTVEALVDLLREEQLGSPVLWIAQSDELCEQAVQSWAEVWRSLGAGRPLQISRLWATNSASVREVGDQVVVATPNKLKASCVGNSDFDWLTKASIVVVDEAHLSTAPMYTEVLGWLGLSANKVSRPLLGLSATPFRGTSKEETKRLAERYGKQRLDSGVFKKDESSTEFLQRRGILAGVDHRILDGASIDLSDDDLNLLETTRSIPRNVLNQVGADADRNDRLISEILKPKGDWPTLVFCASVAHAQTVAALLNREGKASAAVSGKTNPAVRRYLVDQFKSGEIQVLTNCDLLTQGFDAPKVRALFIARPTYSPNRYQQMIGRGLRGPLNGGEAKCLIVNIEDNFERYDKQLAFHEFDYLWNPSQS